ncbi:MAG: thiamine-phosphate kinase [Thermoleophilia bacterium]|nr:thiamine-phosphate kinase [Thermoleophilia bacterium]
MLVAEIGEEALLKELRNLFAATARSVPVGIGDDAAVVEGAAGLQAVWTTDLFLEGVHFESGWQAPGQLGRKCLAVNLSDIAAMGAEPRYALFSLACPGDTDAGNIIDVARGLNDLAAETGVAVIGGDISESREGLLLSVAAGGLVPAGKAVLRSGARAGDAILVTGYLGNAAGGLTLRRKDIESEYRSLRDAFLSPVPRLAEALLAREAGATAMTDLSDGLASDLRHICVESGMGAEIYHERLPVHPELLEASSEYGWDLDNLVLAGGEDYGLLFTMPAGAADAAALAIEGQTGTSVAVIGEIKAGKAMTVVCEYGRLADLPEHGFDHFLPHG